MLQVSALKWIFIGILALLCACGDGGRIPGQTYRGAFDVSKIDAVESIVNEIADAEGLETYRKSRKSMRFLSDGQDAFFVSLVFAGDSVLTVTNVGPGTILSVGTSDHGKMPKSRLDRLVGKILSELDTRLGIKLSEEVSSLQGL